jgi:hypothetical protein
MTTKQDCIDYIKKKYNKDKWKYYYKTGRVNIKLISSHYYFKNIMYNFNVVVDFNDKGIFSMGGYRKIWNSTLFEKHTNI